MKQVLIAATAAMAVYRAPAASLFAQQQTQVMRGTVRDAESKSPIPGVRVVVGDSTSRLGAITDKNGNYVIKAVPIGRRTIRFRSIGYNEVVLSEVLITAGKEARLDVEMVERVIQLQGAEVVFDRTLDDISTVNEYAQVSARSFNLDDTKKYAGSLGDPSRMAQNFAGVVGANDSRNDIVVRGNSPSGMLWQLEGLNIPNPNHFGALGTTGGPVSILNNNTLNKSDFFSGAFPAQYGDASAAVFDLRLRDGNADKVEFLGQVGFNGFEAGAEGPMGIAEGSSFLFNYRYSTLALFSQLGINFGTGAATPNYQDATLRLQTPLGEGTKLIAFAIGGFSDIDLLGRDVDTTEINLYGNENSNIIVDYRTGIAGLSLESNLDEATFLKFTLGVSGTRENFAGDSIDLQRREYRTGESSLTNTKYSAVGQVRHKASSRLSLSGGFSVDREVFNLRRSEFFQPSGTRFDRISASDAATLWQGYAQGKYRFDDRLSAVVGVHALYYSLGEAASVEPRVSVDYYLGDGHSVAAGYGLSSQRQVLYSYFVRDEQTGSFGNIDMGLTRSHQVVLSHDWQFAPKWRLKTELYAQSLFDVPVSSTDSSYSVLNAGASFDPITESGLVNEGTGTNIGAELTLERFFGDGINLLTTVSLFDSKYKGLDGVERNTAFNTGYVVNLLGSKEWEFGDDAFSLSVRLSTTGGRYLTPIDAAASALAGEAVYDDSRRYTERQTPYFRLDTKIAYRKTIGGGTMEFSIDLQNVTNNQNVFLQSYNRRTNAIATEYQQGFFVVPTFRYTF